MKTMLKLKKVYLVVLLLYLAPTTGIASFSPIAVQAATVYSYYPACSSSYQSIVDALRSIGVDSSFANRTKIAYLNGMKNYSGTSAENKKLLSLLKSGKLVKSTSSSNTTSAGTLSLSNATLPSTITQGGVFICRGTVTSSYKLKKVTIAVYNSKGKLAIPSSSKNTSAKKFDLAVLDSGLHFERLSPGTYDYKIIASNTKKSNVVLRSKRFEVISKQSTLVAKNCTYPSTLKAGGVYILRGSVTSNYPLKSVTAGVYDRSGKPVAVSSMKASGYSL